jgi:hypothetical protein
MAATHFPGMRLLEGTSRALRIVLWISIAVSVAAVLRRLVALFHPAAQGPPGLFELDAAFLNHRALTLAHILPSLLFVLAVASALSGDERLEALGQKLLYPLGTVVGVTAYLMSAHVVGGAVELAAVLLFNTLFLLSLGRSYFYSKQHEAGAQKRWLLRAVLVLFGIATTRPVMGLFFATSRFTHLRPQQFFGYAFWIGFSINALLAEIWVRRRPAGDSQVDSN